MPIKNNGKAPTNFSRWLRQPENALQFRVVDVFREREKSQKVMAELKPSDV